MSDYKNLMKNNTQVDVDSLDIPSYGKKANEYKDIVLDTLKEIEKINTRQLKTSGTVWTKENGQLIKVELEDTKKIYRQLIDFFEDLMLRYFDEKIVKNLKEINEKLDKDYKTLIAEYILSEPKLGLKEFVKKTQMFPINNPRTKPYEEKYNEFQQKAYRRKLRELLLLFARKRDLSGKRIASVY